MPEEINRLVTDSIADLHFATTDGARDNLLSEGVDPACIHVVGNTMIDTLITNRDRAIAPEFWSALGDDRPFVLATLQVILFGWVLTLPAAGLIAGSLFYLLAHTTGPTPAPGHGFFS